MENQEKSKNYDHLIRLISEFDNQKLNKIDKKIIQSNGVVYTPNYVAQFIVRNVFKNIIHEKKVKIDLINENLFQIRNDSNFFKQYPNLKYNILNFLTDVKILDPSCGSGIFLVAAAEYLFQLYKLFKPDISNLQLKKKIIQKSIFGVEIDKKAYQISKLRLITWMLSENEFKYDMNVNDLNIKSINRVVDKLDFDLNIFNLDFLLEFTPKIRFDIIIGNPPYIENKKIENNYYKKKLAKYFSSAYKLYDLSILFIEKALNILNENGYISYLMTNKFLAADYGVKIRELISNNSIIKEVINISSLPVFTKFATYPIIIILKKAKPSKDCKIMVKKIDSLDQLNSFSDVNFQDISLSMVRKLPLNVIPISGNLNLTRYLYSNFNQMSEIFNDLKIIYRPFGFLKWQNNFKYLSETKSSDKDLILIGTGNVGKYHVLFNKRIKIAKRDIKIQFFRYNEEFKKVWQELNKEKLVFREIAKNLTFFYDPGVFANLTGLYFLRIPSLSSDELLSLLTILNSEVIDDVFKTLFGTLHMSGGYLRFNGSFIKRIPLPVEYPESLAYLGKIMQFLSQLIYDLPNISFLDKKRMNEFNLYLNFYTKLSNSLVCLLFFKNRINHKVKILNDLLFSKYEFPNMILKYTFPYFDFAKFSIIENEELDDNIYQIKKFYDIFNNKIVKSEMEFIRKF